MSRGAHVWRDIPTHGGPLDARCERCGVEWLEGEAEPAGECVIKKQIPNKMKTAEINLEAMALAESGTATEDTVRRLAYLVALLAERAGQGEGGK